MPRIRDHEIAVHLLLPPDIAPRVTAGTSPPGSPSLERLAATRLCDAIPGLGRSDRLALLLDLCRCLDAMHGIGLVHGDVKPANALVLDGVDPARGSVRIVDLESVQGAPGSVATVAPHERVLTPGHAAPESVRGWAIDARADVFALGTILGDWLAAGEERGSPIVALVEASTAIDRARRPSDARAFARLLAEATGAPDPTAAWCTFPSGPLVGRDEERASLESSIRHGAPGDLVFVRALPGRGLTRFLWEIATTRAPSDRPVRVVDLGSPSLPAPEGLDFVRESARADEAVVLVGVPGSSPMFDDAPAEWRDELRRVAPPSERIHTLPSLGREALARLLVRSRACAPGESERLAGRFDAIVEGDLRRARSWLESDASGRARLEEEAIALAGSRVSAPPETARALVARLAGGGPLELVRELVTTFTGTDAVDVLFRAGELVLDDAGDVRFVSRLAARAARSRSFEPAIREESVEAWLAARFAPRPRDVAQVLDAAGRKERRGAGDAARNLLAVALDEAARERRWPDALALLCDEFPAPLGLSPSELDSAVARTAVRLGRSVPEVAFVAAQAVRSRDLGQATRLWERVATELPPGHPLSVEARLLLLDTALRRGDAVVAARHDAALERARGEGIAIPPGSLERLRAWSAQNSGDDETAERHARAAVDALAAAGDEADGTSRALALQQLATLVFPRDRAEGIALERRAIARAPEAATRAIMGSNLALMLSRHGDFGAAVAAAEDGLRLLAEGGPERVRVALRERRAWAWAALGRTADAEEEARLLVTHPIVAEEPSRHASLELVLAYVALHLGRSTLAVRHALRAVELVRGAAPASTVGGTLAWLLDVSHDAGHPQAALDALATFDGVAASFPPAGSPGSRVAAFLATCSGRPGEALALLAAARSEALRTLEPEEAARFLRHRARILVELGRHEEAVQELDLGLMMLPPAGWEPVRLFLRFDRSCALAAFPPRVSEADDELRGVLAAAERIEARSVQREALRERARRTTSRG